MCTKVWSKRKSNLKNTKVRYRYLKNLLKSSPKLFVTFLHLWKSVDGCWILEKRPKVVKIVCCDNHEIDVFRYKLTWWMLKFCLAIHRLNSNYVTVQAPVCLQKRTVVSTASRKFGFGKTVHLQSPTSTAKIKVISTSLSACSPCCLATHGLFALLHAFIMNKGLFSPHELQRSLKQLMAQLRQAWPFFWLPGRDSLVSARWCVFKGCPAPLKHCIMPALFCLLSLINDTSVFQWTI